MKDLEQLHAAVDGSIVKPESKPLLAHTREG